MAGPKMAIDSTVNVQTTGTYNSPIWGEADLARDVQVAPVWDEAEAFSRQTPVKEYAKGLLGLEFTISVRCDPADPVYKKLMDCWADRKGVLDMMILDEGKDVNGAEGFRFDAGVFDASQEQNLGEVLYRSFKVKPSAHRVNKVKLATVVTGAPVFSDVA